MFLNALPKTEAECPPGTNIYDDSCQLEGSGFLFDGCPPGSKMENGVCVGDSSTYGPDITKTATPGISPMLILAAAAAAFFIGG